MGEADHPVVVAVLAGEQAARLPEQVGAAQKALRNSTPWSASSWMFGRRHLEAVGLDEAAGVVRVDVEDVGTGHARFDRLLRRVATATSTLARRSPRKASVWTLC